MLSYTPVYLWREGNPDYWASAFFESFSAFDPGDDVHLLILLKGFPPGKQPDLISKFSTRLKERLEFAWVADDGLDLTAYRSLCNLRNDPHFLFFNSHSRLRIKNWAMIFEIALKSTRGKGLIGASGSYESLEEGEFPNPHIRTNGFLVAREGYLAASDENPLHNKADCHELEAGENSLTNYFLKQQEPVLVVNSDGVPFDWLSWPESETFRLKDQEKLLVSDNRSQKYHCGFSRRRAHHARASWRDHANTTRIGAITALKRSIWERYLYFGHRFPGRAMP